MSQLPGIDDNADVLIKFQDYKERGEWVDYKGSVNQLLRTIETTWSKIPHVVRWSGSVCNVYTLDRNDDTAKQTLVATFMLIPVLKCAPLPDHL